MPKIYHFSPVTAEFLGETGAALDPIDQLPLVPANATVAEPPAPQEGYASRFTGNAWELVEDHRGRQIWGADGSSFIVDELGALPASALLAPPDLPTYQNLEAARRDLAVWVDQFLAQITGVVSEYERASWPSKAAAARAVLSGGGTQEQTALLQGEADIVGETIAETAAKIGANAAHYEAIISRVTGLRRVVDDELAGAPQAIDYDAIVQSAKARMQEAVTALQAA
ncbi:hypothetical protein [Pseudophaeobacter sp.]|uniref:hypothetical protein n=1 Tax=Pseudophaeobacter sp. TaxID=1971739 RepID=UPI003A9760BF